MSPTTFDHDVAIIGFGPTGVAAANFLGSYGISTLVVEREADIYARARAVTVDGMTIRQFQAVGLDDALKADMDVTTALRWKTYAGREFLRSTLPPSQSGHDPSYMIFQPRMEATLREGVDRYPCVEVHFGEEFTGLGQDGEGVTVATRRVDSGEPASYRARYAIAADGGSSVARRALGIEMVGTTRPRVWVVIDAKVKRWWPERELLTFWSDPVRPVVDIPLALDHHRWEIPLGPTEKKEDFASDEVVWKLLEPLGVTPEHVELLDHAFYSHHLRQAVSWRAGRVLLAGDAAHMMPPWAGQGMQSGMRDGVNLAWKLRAILQHGFSDAILDTYQVERQPNVDQLTRLSVSLGKLIEVRAGPVRLLRDRVLPLLAKLPGGGPRRREVSFDLRSGFLTGNPDKTNAVGRMIPQPRVAVSGGRRVLFDSVLGTDLAVLGLDVDPRELMTPPQAAAWEDLGARFVVIRSAQASPRDDADVVDFEDVLVPWCGGYGARVVVLRPDRIVAATDATGLDVPSMPKPMAGEQTRSAVRLDDARPRVRTERRSSARTVHEVIASAAASFRTPGRERRGRHPMPPEPSRSRG